MPKNQIKLNVVLCLFTIFLAACQFTPDDIFFVEKEKPVAPELEFIELSLETDTIFLSYYKDVQFHFSAGQNSVVLVGILIDGEEKYTRSNYKGNFTILANDLSEGIHKLSFSVITDSNSGSIADLLGYEGFQFISNEWTVVCVKNNRMSDYATKTIEDGKLKLSWEPHNKVNFKHYRIAKRRNDYSGIIKEYYTTNPYFVDEAYVGERAHYDIYTEYHSSDSYYHHWAEFELENTLPEIQMRSTSDGQFEIYWVNNNFIGAIKHYRLIKLPTPADTVTLQESLPNDNNSFIIPGGVFADEINYKLVVVPKHPENPFNNDELFYHSKSYDGMVGEKSFKYRKVTSVNNTELLVLRDGYIYRYQANTKIVLDSLSYNWDNCHVGFGGFSVSPKGNYFTTKESCDNKLVLMNPGNFNNYQAYPINHILIDGLRFESMPVSDNGIVVVKDYERTSVYDVLNDKLIDYIELNSSIRDVGISTNGNYFYIQTHQLNFYKIESDSIAEVWNSPPFYEYVYTHFEYDSQNPENIILYDGKTLYHKNVSDFSTTKQFVLNEEHYLNIDFPTRRLLTYTDGYLSVYSIDTGEQIFQIKADSRVAQTQHHCTLALNTIYLDGGICINLHTH